MIPTQIFYFLNTFYEWLLIGAALEEHLILDNRYTEHSTVGLAQQWDQLDQLSMRMQHNLEQQIQARNHSGKIYQLNFNI